MIWNFSLNIAGPFFNVYLVKDLSATAFMVGFLSIVSSISGLPAQRLFGQLNDRWGPRKVILCDGLDYPDCTLCLVFCLLRLACYSDQHRVWFSMGWLWPGFVQDAAYHRS